MTFRPGVCSCVMLVAWLSAPVAAAAECVRLPAKDMAKRVMEDKAYEVVFTGTVVGVIRTSESGYRATFAVERVWKGTVTKRFDLYVWELNTEIPRFEVGQHYLALATRLVASREREGAGVPGSDAVAFTPVHCSDALSLDPDLVRYLGAGLAPKEGDEPSILERHAADCPLGVGRKSSTSERPTRRQV